MHEQQAVLAAAARQLAQELPAPQPIGRAAWSGFQLLPRPKDRPLGAGVESLGIEQRPLIVIAQQAEVELHHLIDAFQRIRPVADDVAEAVDLRDPLLPNVGQHRLESLQVAVDIADEGSLHAWLPKIKEGTLTPVRQTTRRRWASPRHQQIATPCGETASRKLGAYNLAV